MILKLFLIISITFFGVWLIKERNTVRVRAWQKIIVILFVLGIIVITLLPNFSLQIALFFGLNRATDLIVYGTIILLLFIAANTYLKFQDLQSQISRIAREVSIQEGLKNYPSWTEKQ
jgi:hypothetical protein